MQKIILGLAICISSCKTVQIPDSNSRILPDNIEISLKLTNCIDIYKKDTVTFSIYNGNNIGFWVASWNLRLDSITNISGEVISSRSLVDYRHPDLPKFTWVNACSEVRISYQTDFFFRANLKKIENYYVYASYRKFIDSKTKLNKDILVNHININRIDFWTCP